MYFLFDIYLTSNIRHNTVRIAAASCRLSSGADDETVHLFWIPIFVVVVVVDKILFSFQTTAVLEEIFRTFQTIAKNDY